MTLIESGLQFLNHWKQPLRPDDMFNFPAASPHFYSMCDAQCHGAAVSSPSTRNGKEGREEGKESRGLQWFKAPCIFSIWRTLLVTESMVHWAMKEPICSPPGDGLWNQLATTLQKKKSILTSRLIWYHLYLSLKKSTNVWKCRFLQQISFEHKRSLHNAIKPFYLIKANSTHMVELETNKLRQYGSLHLCSLCQDLVF